MRTQRLTQALVAGGVAALGVGCFAPTLAIAAASDSVTVAGGSSYTYTFNQSPSISATAQPNCKTFSNPSPVTLTISGPGVVSSTLASHKADCSKALTFSPSSSSVNTRHPAWAGGSTMASNGVFTVTLNNQGRTNTASFTLLIPPAKPASLTVTPDSPTSATFTWPANPEPDIVGYEITNSSGTVVADPSYNNCSGGTCSDGPVDLGNSVSGKTMRYSVTALRSCGNASCAAGHIASSSSASGSADFPSPPPPPPSPSPTPTKSSSGGGTNSGGGSNNGGGGSHQGGGGSTSLGTVTTDGGGGRDSSAVNLGSADSAGQVSHNLAPAGAGPLPAVGAPALPPVQTSLGAVDNTPPGKIHYPKPLLAKQNASAPKTIERALKNGLQAKPLWRGVAAAAVLILIAVHLRAWVARTEAF